MTITSPLSIVVIGYGLIGPRHAIAVDECPLTQLVAIVDPFKKHEKRHRARAQFPSVPQFKTLSDLFDSGIHIDGAIVCTPNHTHLSVAHALAERGVAMLIEKPISPSVEDALQIKKIAEESGVKLIIGHHRRFNPYVLATKRNLERCGKIIAVDAVWCLKKCESYFKQTPWRCSKALGGGVINLNLVHDLDLLQYFLGPIQSVYASECEKTRDDNIGDDAVVEGAVLTISFKSGTRGSFIVCDNVVSPANFEMGTGENPLIHKNSEGIDGVFYRFFGTRGTLSVPDMRLFHQDGIKEAGWWQPISKETLDEDVEGVPFALQVEHFAKVMRDEEVPRCTADDGIAAMLAIDAVVKSLETDMPVAVADY
jgi:myo-inositol 2-dehydrogenase/D-chiro-inositol 1-dehydrogenase